MEKEARENIIYDLGHEIYDFLEADHENDNRLASLVDESGGNLWGLDTFNELDTWSDEESEIGFFADISFSGKDTMTDYSSLTLKVKGRA